MNHDKVSGAEQVAPVNNSEPKGGTMTATETAVERHGEPQVVATEGGAVEGETTIQEIQAGRSGWFAYLKTRNFYVVLVAGFVRPPNACRPIDR